MERESQDRTLKLKNRLGELNALVREIAKSIGETHVETAFPTGIRDFSLITLEENGNKVNWWRYDNDYYMVTTGEIPIEYFEKDIKEVKLMLLKEFQEGLKSYNKEFNIFGDDITDYDKDYILQHIVINKVGVSKYLEWELYNREGIFLPEWFGMNLKDVMIKDLHARRLSAELEIEILEDKIRKIDREIKRYENNSY